MRTKAFKSFYDIPEGVASTALAAIEARINGVFDHPALRDVGALSTNVDEDVLRILEMARRGELREASRITLETEYPETAPEERIRGVFVRQAWVGALRASCIEIERVEFDATALVLGLSLDELHELEDCSEASDDLGRQVVSHAGPCDVFVEDAIVAFFDVEVLTDITQEMLDEKRALYGMAQEAHGMCP